MIGHTRESAWLHTVSCMWQRYSNKAHSLWQTAVASPRGKLLQQVEVHHQAAQSVATATTQPQHARMSLCPYPILISPNTSCQRGCLWNWSGGVSEREGSQVWSSSPVAAAPSTGRATTAGRQFAGTLRYGLPALVVDTVQGHTGKTVQDICLSAAPPDMLPKLDRNKSALSEKDPD